jgi:hypothetical protein
MTLKAKQTVRTLFPSSSGRGIKGEGQTSSLLFALFAFFVAIHCQPSTLNSQPVQHVRTLFPSPSGRGIKGEGQTSSLLFAFFAFFVAIHCQLSTLNSQPIQHPHE